MHYIPLFKQADYNGLTVVVTKQWKILTMSKPFITDTFDPPKSFDNRYFHFTVLNDDVAELDFEAVMSSQKRLQGIFGSGSKWPKCDMTLTENIASLKVHQQEFESRQAFAYSVFNKLKNKCLGSVYIDPSDSSNYQCVVYLWVRDDSFELDNQLYQTVCKWLSDKWGLSKIAFPGRDIVWSEWDKELGMITRV